MEAWSFEIRNNHRPRCILSVWYSNPWPPFLVALLRATAALPLSLLLNSNNLSSTSRYIKSKGVGFRSLSTKERSEQHAWLRGSVLLKRTLFLSPQEFTHFTGSPVSTACASAFMNNQVRSSQVTNHH
jgi:hypothetical protein